MHNDLPRPVFVLGVRKSGARLLQQILSNHPALCAPAGEPLSSDRSGRARVVRPADAPVAGAAEWPAKLLSDSRIDCFAHPAYQPVYRLTEADVETGDRERLVAAYRARMSEPARRLVHYDPPHLVRSRYLQALFPDALFVLVVRDPYANVAAAGHGRSKWGNLEGQTLQWSAGHDAVLADRRFLKRRMIVHYEELVSEPIRTLDAVCHFCRIDFEAEMLMTVDLRAGFNERLIKSLDPRDLRIITRTCRRTMTRLHYMPRDRSGAIRPRRVGRQGGADPQPVIEPRQAA